jgi:ABC-type nitrate/sulfonate/bicarbonate transport system permease component
MTTVLESDKSASADATVLVARDGDVRRHRRQQRTNVLLAVLGWTLFLGAWEVAARTGMVDASFSSMPSRWSKALFELMQGEQLWSDIYDTTRTMLIGFVLGIVVGVPAGLLFSWSHVADKMTGSIVAALYSLPYVAFVPLTILWFGITDTSRIALITWSSLFPMLINTSGGVRNLNRQFLRVAEAYCAPQHRMITTVVLPATLPYILTGMRLAIGRALVAAIVAEFFMASNGLGYFINQSAATFNMDNAFAALVVTGLLGVMLVQVTSILERRFSSWTSAG